MIDITRANLITPITPRYPLLGGPFAGRTVNIGFVEIATIDIPNGCEFETYQLVPGKCEYQWQHPAENRSWDTHAAPAPA